MKKDKYTLLFIFIYLLVMGFLLTVVDGRGDSIKLATIYFIIFVYITAACYAFCTISKKIKKMEKQEKKHIKEIIKKIKNELKGGK